MIGAPWSLWRLGWLFLLATATALVGWFTLSGKDSRPDETAAAKKAIQQVLDDQAKAWNRGDLEGFMKGYWKSRKLTFFSGKDKTQGWQATIERYRKRYQTEGRKMGKLTFSDLEIEVVGPTQAWARGRWKVVRDKETLSGLFTLILKKLPEGWRIVHDHTSAG
jgi:beta-aspartyl-peptidase (threonine type)